MITAMNDMQKEPSVPRQSRRPPSPRRGEGWGEGVTNYREGGAPHSIPLPMGEGAGPFPGEGVELDPSALYRLMAWLSPAYPVGAFSYSGGLEWAVESGDIRDANSLTRWLTAMIRHGSVSSDAGIFCHAHRAAARGDDDALAATAELAAAL